MTTNRGPFVRLHLYARRTIMPTTILHDDSTTPVVCAENRKGDAKIEKALALRACDGRTKVSVGVSIGGRVV